VILSYIKKNPEAELETWDSSSNARSSISFANELAKQFQLWMRGMFWKNLSEYCELFVPRSAFLSTWRCWSWPPVYATGDGSGQNIGTTRSQDRYRSSPTNREKEMFQTVSREIYEPMPRMLRKALPTPTLMNQEGRK